MEALAAVEDIDNLEDMRALVVDNLAREDTAAGKDDILHKQEEEDAEADDCNRIQVVDMDCTLAVDTYYSCTAAEVVVVVAVPDKPPYHNDLVVEDTEDILEVDAEDRDCNCSNYYNHNQTVVECCRIFL